jgi:hypothetical protein
MTKLSTISKARAADLDARVLKYLRRRGEAGALPSVICDDLAARGSKSEIAVSLGRLERAGHLPHPRRGVLVEREQLPADDGGAGPGRRKLLVAVAWIRKEHVVFKHARHA